MAPGATTLKRINREMQDLQKEDLGDITLAPLETNMHIWRGTIPGPEGSVYEGGVFHVEVVLPNDYPFSAPKAIFKTRIYHMNISDQGNICIDILKHNWSPALSLFKVMLSLSSLLTDPNPKDPLVPSIATEYLRNRKQHDSKARQWTEMYAKPKPAVKATPAPTPTPVVSPARPGRSRRGAAAAVQTTAAPPQPSRLSAPSSRAGSSRVPSQPSTSIAIVIDDSDDEGRRNSASTSRAKRKRSLGEESTGAGASSSRTRRNVASTLVDAGVLEIPDDEPAPSRPKRTRTTRNASSSSSNDVIVIED
ncbi:hypothetical protein D9611_007780 [Ephemerocybe angulata]|uniref:E2 ubiquitin-conjugating enzyme n=1 Tax=Ephemerocybe angulata TaxID=980116 RepID=A0A8H5CEQ6_9AGAR|nr:hypothetical protein D9611_007780 [Tulosesus angulatus]